MENASKALIIAGAILLSILIITLGILVFNQARGVMDTNAMSDIEIQQFNQKFTQYEGTRVRGATVNSMLQTVLANNTSVDDDTRKVAVTGSVVMTTGSSGLPTTKANTGAIYSITCEYSDNGGNKGLVKSIKVEKK